MAQSSKEVLCFLGETLTGLDKLAVMFPEGMKHISAELKQLKDVTSAITISQTEIHEINDRIKALQLDSQCKHTSHMIPRTLCLTDAQGKPTMTFPSGSQHSSHQRGIRISLQHGFEAPANG